MADLFRPPGGGRRQASTGAPDEKHWAVSFLIIQLLGITEIVERLADEQAESHIHSRRLNASTWNFFVCLQDRDSAK